MKLLTKALMKKIPPIYSTDGIPQDEKVAVIKLFDPYGGWTLYIVEGEELEDGDWEFYGLVTGIGEPELGYSRLSEIESLIKFGRPRIERDKYFDPCKIKDI